MKDPQERGKWRNKTEFLLVYLGSTVGYGNLWRFPYLCFKNGGLAFLIPYAILLVFASFPILFMDLCLGQFFSGGANTIFAAISSDYVGIGYSMIVVSFIMGIYYNFIFAWTLFYLFATFQSPLPWSTCDNDFNSPDCFSRTENQKCLSSGLVLMNGSCVEPEVVCDAVGLQVFNSTHCARAVNSSSLVSEFIPFQNMFSRMSSTEDYFRTRMLGVTGKTWDNMGELRWEIVGCYALAWIMVGLCMCQGIKSSGRVVYLTATAPYLMLTVLVIRGLTLDGAYNGVKFYILNFESSKLLDAEVWNEAASQLLFSTLLGCGQSFTIASYNSFNSNCLKNGIFLAIANSMTSIYAGFAVFSVLGFIAKELQVEVKDVVLSGSGLTFIAFPEALSKIPFPIFWSALFFIMLIAIGIDSQIVVVETVGSAITDQFPSLRPKKNLLGILVCVVMFLLGLPICLEGGFYLFEVLYQYAGGISLIILCLAEVLVVQNVYGFENLMQNIQNEMKIFVPRILKGFFYITWQFITPLALTLVILLSLYYHGPARSGSYVFPASVQICSWLICSATIVCFPIFFIWNRVYKRWRNKTLQHKEKVNKCEDFVLIEDLSLKVSEFEGETSDFQGNKEV